jgi:group-specific protein, putative
MNRVELMRSESQNTSVSFKIFMSIVKSNRLPICFEGKDIQYYRNRIEQYLTENFGYIDCSGKSKVLSLREEIQKNSQYRNKLCIYFVDCDFDDNSDIYNKQDVYITPCYSIENLYTSDRVFEKILSDEFGINPSNDEQSELFSKILSEYRNRKREFFKCIEEFNFYVYLIKLNQFGISYNDIKISDLVKINIDSVTKSYTSISKVLKDIDLNNFDLSKAQSYFSGKDPEHCFRGKNNFHFLEKLLIKLQEDASKKDGRKIFPKKMSISYTTQNLLSSYSKYAETPQCLIDFLSSYKSLL